MILLVQLFFMHILGVILYCNLHLKLLIKKEKHKAHLYYHIVLAWSLVCVIVGKFNFILFELALATAHWNHRFYQTKISKSNKTALVLILDQLKYIYLLLQLS
jgi:hypothetical protein